MPAKSDSVEQIVAKLREAERLQGQGLTIARDVQAAEDQRSDVLSLADGSTGR